MLDPGLPVALVRPVPTSWMDFLVIEVIASWLTSAVALLANLPTIGMNVTGVISVLTWA